MDTLPLVILVLAIFVGGVFLLFNYWMKKKPVVEPTPLPGNWRDILQEQVPFYNQLDASNKISFENRLQHFLSRVRIVGVKTTVEDLDRILVAASAIIPIFYFPHWEYNNLNDVLLYPDAFNDEFAHEGDGRDTLGVVGTGAYQNIMILSQHELRQGFLNKTGKTNTAIHEFIHLVDKTDGSVDGIPEILLSKNYVLPWLDLMQREIKQIMSNRSDINPYGAKNRAEFFAVVSEYFFERPDLLKQKHPELYELLNTMFSRQTVLSNRQ
jgi:Mlc titration factor MtfA (ptsG expression regulator)